MRELTYAQAIREGHAELLRNDPRVVVLGQGLWSPWYAGGSTRDLEKEFGRERVIDSPVSENSVTAAAAGAAVAGMRPIVFHPRMDFMLLAFDAIVNQAANWSYLFRQPCPLVVRASINRGGEQGAQHSQALHAMLMHVPGLKVVMPASPADAKGLLIAAVNDGNPVVYVDDRWLYGVTGDVMEGWYETPIGKANIVRRGTDITVAALSWGVSLALSAAAELEKEGISVELLDLRSAKPWDKETTLASVAKTGRFLMVDSGWRTAGASAEVVATVAEEGFGSLVAPPGRVALPDCPAPVAESLEKAYYPSWRTVAETIRVMLK